MSETITVVGNIAEPEFKETEGGLHILNFRIASTERRFDKQTGGWVEGETSWYSVSAFRQLADHASRSLRKGDRVVVTGRLRLREWDTGSKKGVTAQIDADAVGHDLRWGTSIFHRDSPAGAAASGAPKSNDWGATVAVASEVASEWEATPPGEGGADVSPESDDASSEEATELAGAGAPAPF